MILFVCLFWCCWDIDASLPEEEEVCSSRRGECLYVRGFSLLGCLSESGSSLCSALSSQQELHAANFGSVGLCSVASIQRPCDFGFLNVGTFPQVL